MSDNVIRAEGDPVDRLTRLCEVANQAIKASPEHRDGDKLIICLDDGTTGGMEFIGYDEDGQAIADLFMHLQAVLTIHGKRLAVVEI